MRGEVGRGMLAALLAFLFFFHGREDFFEYRVYIGGLGAFVGFG